MVYVAKPHIVYAISFNVMQKKIPSRFSVLLLYGGWVWVVSHGACLDCMLPEV